ncbi:MAG: FAD-dependent monooxygenase, partial [Flavobacteriales bacterium]|nr:FAD-dependent monooxygenase [Flavobacteriales bacterium]
MNTNKRMAVIGGGLVGSLWALYLGKQGYHVDLYERRSDPRARGFIGGRSINLALSNRGWKALDGVGMSEKIQSLAIPMHQRIMHDQAGNITYQPYGKEGEAIYSVPRGPLNLMLLERADEHPNVTLYFEERCKDIDLDSNTVTFIKGKNEEEHQEQYDHIFGTDGAFSSVRLRLMKTDRFNYEQVYLTHGYKELEIPPSAANDFQLDPNALHIWPRGEYMMIALPNPDKSFTCTLFFPFEGETSFDSLKDMESVLPFFKEQFGDAVPMMPKLLEDYKNNPTSSLVTLSCSPWNFEDKVLLLGDASHAIVPFYGQGMNSGFEDCSLLHDMMMEMDGDLKSIFPAFSKMRFPQAQAIRELALRNYIEMRDKTADPEFLLQKKIERRFSDAHPDKWTPLYSQVTFS